MHGELLPPPLQGLPRPDICVFDRDFSSATDSWSSEAQRCKSGYLNLAGVPKNHRTIDGKLAQPFSASSSTAPGRIPSLKELQEELEGQARMAAKVREAENKRASKARIREGERGQWWPCETTDVELRELQNEGMISAHWSFIRDTDIPKPGADEVVMTKAWVERGLSLPCSEFFLSILSTYGLQPHNICPNSYLLSNFATLCEGHLGIRPDVAIFFRVKKETKDKAMVNCGSMTFILRPGRMYPPHDSHESVRSGTPDGSMRRTLHSERPGLPKFVNEPPEELASWSFVPSLAQTPLLEKAARRISCSILWRRKTLRHTSCPCQRRRAEEVPDEEEEEEQHPARQLLVPGVPAPKLPARAEPGPASAKKPKTKSEYHRHPDHQPRAHHEIHEKVSGCWSLYTSSAKHLPHCSSAISPQADQSPPPATNTPPEIIPVSSEKEGREDPKAKGPAPDEAEIQGQGEAKVTSSEKAEAGAGDVVVFPKNFGDPADLTSTPKAYATKFFNKLTEAEKWELEQDLLNAM
ncbi:hypothetical protein QYE76_041331 [Lolium multiflorum]|uniref:Transposase (putative) gypsy type domain-containing protein n=1 Tax=Lolium multiflorum TaxID=4521 RepID=A0AAD8TF32_LOLMU|nr:hypothetical protein QYE76_041331 [Lolium multiflorum]